MRRIGIIFLVICALSPGIAAAEPENGTALRITRSAAGGDAVVVAVIDSGFSPYHWDYLSSKMPQHQDDDRTNDLPLNDAPHSWL
ncbi:MAG TPA: hypothetical protein VG408_08235, partial [Actinomycetota bacterium]|nr:hypothetical protein [Actinomycetota bacterium]